MTFEQNSVFYVDDIGISHSWWTVEDFNENLYMQVVNKNTTTTHDYIIELTDKNHIYSRLFIDFIRLKHE